MCMYRLWVDTISQLIIIIHIIDPGILIYPHVYIYIYYVLQGSKSGTHTGLRSASAGCGSSPRRLRLTSSRASAKRRRRGSAMRMDTASLDVSRRSGGGRRWWIWWYLMFFWKRLKYDRLYLTDMEFMKWLKYLISTHMTIFEETHI